LACELVDVEAGGVDDEVRAGAQVGHEGPLGGDRVEQPPGPCKRVGSPHTLEAAHERLVGRIEEDHDRSVATGAQLPQGVRQAAGQRPASGRR
jgi:hypothetical protein